MRKSLLNQPLDIYDFQQLEHLVRANFLKSRQLKIVTLNPEMIVNAKKNFEFQAALNNANIVIPDGTGITWAFEVLSGVKVNRVPGIELAERILSIANELNKSVAIFGGTSETLEKVLKLFKSLYPKINVVKLVDGYQGINQDDVIAKEISGTSPDVVLVALGSPRQEVWINKNSDLFPRSILIGIGGSLDVWAGKVMRAPEWMRTRGLEWLFRLISQPKRSTRILKSLPVFVFMVLTKKLGSVKSSRMN